MWKLLVTLLVVCATCRAESDSSNEVAKLKANILSLEASVAKSQGAAKGLEGELSSCQALLTQRGAELEKLQQYESQVATLTAQLQVASGAAEKVPGLEARAAEADRAAQQCSQELASLEDEANAAKARVANCGSLQQRVEQLTSELSTAKQAASECSSSSSEVQAAAAASAKAAQECLQRVGALETESASAKDGIAECEARIERQRPARQALELERSKLLEAERSLKEQLAEVKTKLADVETHWLPLWLHAAYEQFVEPLVRYYEEMIVTGKLYAQIKAKALVAYGATSRFASENGKIAYASVSAMTADFLRSKAGQEAVRLYHIAAGHALNAYAKLQSQVDKVLLHPEVQHKLQLVRNQLGRLEQDLVKLLLHALRSHPSVEPFAEEDIARALARGLIYGIPAVVLLYLLCGCCCSQRSGGRGGQETAAFSRPVAKASSSSSVGRKVKGKGHHATRL